MYLLRLTPRPGVSVTRTVPFMTSWYELGSQTSSAHTSLPEIEWKLAATHRATWKKQQHQILELL